MAYISESICKISKQRQDNYNDYYFYPQNNANFKKEAFEDKIVIVKIFNANKQLIDEFNINVNTFWKSDISTQIRTTTRNGQDVSKKYNNSKIFAFPKRYINKFDINTFFNNIKYWLYSAGEKSYKWDEFYKDGIMAIGWDYLGDLTKYSSQAEIADKITKEENKTQYPKNDSKANWEFVKDMHIGDIVYVKKGLQDALIGRGIVKSDYIYDANRNEYKSIRKIEWTHNGIYDVDFKVLDIKQWNQKTLTEISQSKYKDFCLKIEDVFMKKQPKENSNSLQVNIPLNQILYGPPGTGKTYSVRQYITDIVGQNPGLKTDNEEQKINNAVKDLTWYSAIALSMYKNGKNNKYKVPNLQHQKIIKAFAATKESKKIKATLWFQMQSHTSESSENVNNSTKHPPYLFDKTENSEWYLTETGIKFVEENLSEQLEFLNAKNSSRKIEDFYKFITFHQSYSYEEFVEGIKPSINNDEDNATISYEYNRGIFKEICQQANSDPENNYLLIIDEINRGNISKIFGELITLIESDKRVIPNGERIFENTKTQNEELVVTLPYTKSKFGVPSNLYILGTMNTSDRSIASIDIALRRRFKFVEMMPKRELVADFGINFADVFENLNTKIKILLDRDHQIGHSYFIKTKYENAGSDELKAIWFSEILPLLNEYFYCDWEKLKLVVPGFIKKVEIPSALKNDCDEDIYEFKTFDEVEDFEVALKSEKFE
ncbi:MAG: AAA family ATPase [Candidatus Gastranaerophilaceae bacterium]